MMYMYGKRLKNTQNSPKWAWWALFLLVLYCIFVLAVHPEFLVAP